MPTKKKLTASERKRIHRLALVRLHERGYFTSEERHAGMDPHHCVCGNAVFAGNLICNECVVEQAPRTTSTDTN